MSREQPSGRACLWTSLFSIALSVVKVTFSSLLDSCCNSERTEGADITVQITLQPMIVSQGLLALTCDAPCAARDFQFTISDQVEPCSADLVFSSLLFGPCRGVWRRDALYAAPEGCRRVLLALTAVGAGRRAVLRKSAVDKASVTAAAERRSHSDVTGSPGTH